VRDQRFEGLLRLAHRHERLAVIRRQHALEPRLQVARHRPPLALRRQLPRTADQLPHVIGILVAPDRASEDQRQRHDANLNDIRARVERHLARARRHCHAELLPVAATRVSELAQR
jgi:hypothetical protein